MLPLLKHQDMYVREGALMALSNCGKEAAKHLDKIVPLADDDDWWVRAGVAYVLHHVDQPETGNYVSQAVRSFLAEQSVFGRNRIHSAVAAVAQRGSASDEIVQMLIDDARGDDPSKANTAVRLLAVLGPSAKPALPIFEEKLATAKEALANATEPGKKKQAEQQIKKWEGVIGSVNPPAKPTNTKPPRKKRK